jgi:hypothetical protein
VKAVNYPFAVTVDGFDAKGAPVSLCSGALLAPSLVLTAGQCAKAASWRVTAPYAGGQTAVATMSSQGDWAGVPAGEFLPSKSDTGFLMLEKPIELDQYPALADASTCMGCEVVHIGRVSHAVDGDGADDADDRHGIAPGNAGGPIVRLADGAIIGVSSGTLGDKKEIAARPPMKPGDTIQMFGNRATYWSKDDLWESPIHIAVPSDKAMVVFPQHSLLNLAAKNSVAHAGQVQKLVSNAGVGAGGVADAMKSVSHDMASTVRMAPPLPPMEPTGLHAQALHALAGAFTPPYPYMPSSGRPQPSTPPPAMTAPQPAPSFPPFMPPQMTPPPAMTAAQQPAPSIPPGQILQGIGNLVNLVAGIMKSIAPPNYSPPQNNTGLGALLNSLPNIVNLGTPSFGQGFNLPDFSNFNVPDFGGSDFGGMGMDFGGCG